MDIAVLTFPGHVLQTTLCIKSLIDRTSPRRIFVLVDDYASGKWTNYVDDVEHWLTGYFQNTLSISQRPELIFKKYSELNLATCTSGWWRAQLVKLYCDQILDIDKVFLVDGDIVFDKLSDINALEHTIPYTQRTPGQISSVAVLHQNYVKRLLGIDQGFLTANEKYVATSPVPFRVVTKNVLNGLRQHVEQRYQKSFLQLHLDWFADQTIIGYEDPPTRMIMTEWELIECYRRHVLGLSLSMIDLGSGYPIEQNTSTCSELVVYKHSYKRDFAIGRSWFESRLGLLPDSLWSSIELWTL